MAYTYEIIESIIPNTVMQKAYLNGTFRSYRIQANEDYVLHDTQYDLPVYNENWNETGEISLGYHTGVVSCAASYDFALVQMQDENGNIVISYGSRQYFTKLVTEVGDSAGIFGVDTPSEPEIM